VIEFIGIKVGGGKNDLIRLLWLRVDSGGAEWGFEEWLGGKRGLPRVRRKVYPKSIHGFVDSANIC
jgi:hypothetical protein